jgi:geranylgeranyl diphosphate synthase type II
MIANSPVKTASATQLPLAEMPMGPWLSPHLRASLQHGLQSRGGGFRVRLVEALCAVCQIEPERAQSLGTALEYFHLASLLLDDMPCMDDAETRRGLPCTHRVYGDSMAILSALALINRAYFLVWDAVNGALPDVHCEVNNLLDQCLGLNGILNGQALDLKFVTTDRSPAMIERIALLKTGALLRLSMLLPLIAGNGNAAPQRTVRRLSDSWGCTYQLLDDLKDLEWGEQASGKTPLRDEALNRPNLALAVGKEKSVARLRKHLSESRQLVDSLTGCGLLAEALEPFQSQLEQMGESFLAECAA